MINLVILQGRFTADPELKTTKNNKSVTSFVLANNRDAETTFFIPCVAWGKTAEIITHWCRKGTAIAVSGEIQSRKYQDKDGNNRNLYEVNVREVHFLEKKKEESFERVDESETASEEPETTEMYSDMGDLPF